MRCHLLVRVPANSCEGSAVPCRGLRGSKCLVQKAVTRQRGTCIPLGVHWGHSSARPPAGPQVRPSHSSWCGCSPAAAASPGAPSLVPRGVWHLLSHHLRLHRQHSVSASSADAWQDCGFSFVLQKVPSGGPQVRVGVGAAPPAITRPHPFNEHPPSSAAGAPPGSGARGLGQVGFPHTTGLPTVCTGTGRLSPSPHHGAPPSLVSTRAQGHSQGPIQIVSFPFKTPR